MKNTYTKKVKLSDLKFSPVRQETLPEDFIKRVIEYKKILKEVDTITLEETIDCFQRDMDPEKELFIWENIAEIYLKNTENKNYLLEEKREIFKKILIASLGDKN
jgi:hypothetical protein